MRDERQISGRLVAITAVYSDFGSPLENVVGYSQVIEDG